MGLGEELEQIAVAAGRHLSAGEELAAVIPAEPAAGERVYLCAFAGADDSRAWLALDADGATIDQRRLVRGAVAIAALCEAAEDAAAHGLEEEPGDSHVTVTGLEAQPRLATPSYLDELGAAAREREQANGHVSDSPFADAMRAATPMVEALELDVERGYKVPLR